MYIVLQQLEIKTIDLYYNYTHIINVNTLFCYSFRIFTKHNPRLCW